MSRSKTRQLSRGHAMLEIAMFTPLLLLFGLGVADYGNILNSYLVLSHLGREAGSILSRETGTKGSATWVQSVNNDLSTVITYAAPVINLNGSGATGPNQFKIYYTMIEWNAAAAVCDRAVDNTLPTSCIGTLSGGGLDRYRIRRGNTGWSGNVTWNYGNLTATSKMGVDGECACKTLPQVKQLTTQGLTLHAIEIFYDYGPSSFSKFPLLLKTTGIGIYYAKSIFLGVT